MPDAVDHPAHYGGEDNPYEVIKVMRAWDLELARGFCWGSLLKYTARAGKKGSSLEDRQKAEWYAAELVSIEAELADREDKDRYKEVWFRDIPVKIDFKERTWRIIDHRTSGGSNDGGGGYYGPPGTTGYEKRQND